MGTFSVGGLASGLDTKSIIDQMMSIERRGKVKLEWNRALWDARKSTWGDLNTRLNSLQQFANALNNPATWAAGTGTTSSDASKVGASATGATPAQGTYTMNVSQLAAAEKWAAANNLPGSTAGVRQSGRFYSAANTSATATTTLVGLRDQFGTALGLNNGSSITMDFVKGGVTSSATFNVTGTTTLNDLRAWVETQSGTTATLNGDGSISYASASGTAEEITALSMTARNSAGTVLNRFNGAAGAQTSMVTAATDGGATAADTLTISQGASNWYVNVAVGDTEADILNKINAIAGVGVDATLVGGKLNLTAKATGAASDFAVTSSGTLATSLGLAETQAGADSAFDVNGTAYTRSTNTGITDVIDGVTLDLNGLTAGAVTVAVGTPGASTGDLKKKIMDFVNQYNSVVDFVAAKTGETKKTNPGNLGEYLQGPMSRDFNFGSVSNELRRWTTDSVNGLPAGSSMLADIGITTGAFSATFNKDNTTGKLVVDEAKLEAALNTDPAKVKDIFTKIGGGTLQDDGIAKRVSQLVSQWRTGGKVDGALQGTTSQIARLQDSIDRFEQKLTMKQKYYERIFTSLETTMGRMQSQNSFLSGQFAQLSGG